jgi:hypothetical protein
LPPRPPARKALNKQIRVHIRSYDCGRAGVVVAMELFQTYGEYKWPKNLPLIRKLITGLIKLLQFS